MKKIITILGILTLVLLASCTPKARDAANNEGRSSISSSGRTIIRFGHAGGEVEEQTYRASLAGVEEALNVEIEWMRYPDFAQFWTQVAAQVAAGTAPDLTALTNEQYMEFIENGLFLNMVPYITKEDYDFDRVSETHKCWIVNGGIYGIPQDGAPAAFIINMDLWNAAGLGELPKTLDEVHAAARILTKGDVKGLCLNLHEFHVTQYVLAYGGGWGMGKTINTPQNAQGLQFLIDLYKEGLIITPQEAGLGWDGDVFARGMAAMSTGGVWYAAALQESAPEMNYRIIPIPKGTVNGCTSHSDATAVLSTTKNPELASKVAAYMGRPDAQNAIAEAYGNPPAYKDLQSSFFEKNKEIASLYEAIAWAQPFNYPVEAKRFTDALSKELDEAFFVINSGRTGTQMVANIAAAMGL